MMIFFVVGAEAWQRLPFEYVTLTWPVPARPQVTLIALVPEPDVMLPPVTLQEYPDIELSVE